MKRRRVFLAMTLFVLSAGHALAAKEMRLRLQYIPQEDVTANVPVIDSAVPVRALEVRPLVDARALPDLSLVGENQERKTFKPVRSLTPIATFATDVFKRCLSEWGVRLGPGDLVLKGEITNLFVTEGNMYSTAVNIRFRVETTDGSLLWQGIAVGDARQFGRSFKDENYNEQISDALKRAFANLVSNQGFQKAWAGAAEADPSVDSGRLKEKILEMMAAGVGAELITAYVAGIKLSSPLSADQILEWKRSGIPESVIQAAVKP